MALRIRGLVSLMNRVRQRLATGLGAQEAAALQQQVRDALAVVERLCREHGAAIADLPAPTRRAYQYLAQLEVQAETPGPGVPLPAPASSAPGAVQYRVKGLRQALVSFLNQLAAAANEAARERFRAEAGEYLMTLSRLFREDGSTFADLPLRQQRQILRLEAYLEDPWHNRIPLVAAGFVDALEKRWPPVWRCGVPLVFFQPSDTRLWQVRPAGRETEVRVSDLFLIMDGRETAAQLSAEIVARLKGRRSRGSTLRDRLHGPQVLAFKQQIEAGLVHSEAAARGVVYDLKAMFEQLNRRYFGARLEQQGLYWTRSQARCRTGYYNPVSGEIHISAALDNTAVPEYVVAFVLYHEMLHMEQGADLLKRGRRVHNKAFRERERAFPAYHEAEAFLQRLATMS